MKSEEIGVGNTKVKFVAVDIENYEREKAEKEPRNIFGAL